MDQIIFDESKNRKLVRFLPVLSQLLPEVVLSFSESGWDFFFFLYLCYAVSMEAQLHCSILSKKEIENIDT